MFDSFQYLSTTDIISSADNLVRGTIIFLAHSLLEVLED